jgi:hypothetical protein
LSASVFRLPYLQSFAFFITHDKCKGNSRAVLTHSQSKAKAFFYYKVLYVDITIHLWLYISVYGYVTIQFYNALSALRGYSMGANLVGTDERFELEVVLAAIDNNGVQQERSKTYRFSSGVTVYADALAAAGAFITALLAIEEADLIKYVLRVVSDESTGAVASVGNVYKEAILTLRIDGSTKKAAHTILSPYDAMVSGNNVVSTAALQTYLDFFETGGDFTISDGEAISTVEGTRIAASRVRQIAARL